MRRRRYGARVPVRDAEWVAGRYELLALISRGANGAVHRARDHATGATVALKQLLDVAQLARFEIEARVLARLRHPRVVRVLDHVVEPGAACLVMELVEGEDLAAHARRRGGRLPVAEAVRYAVQACEALAYVHEQHTAHRDVKPRNLVLGADGVVLVDFGAARAGEAASGTVIGTPGYMAPEVWAEGAAGPAQDVYGVAATLWALVAGEPPVLGDRTPPSGVPPEVGHALTAGLEPDHRRRVGSAEALARLLDGSADLRPGRSLALFAPGAALPRRLLEAILRTAGGVLDAASVSLAFVDGRTGELVYQAGWGTSAEEVVGLRLAPGRGIAGAAVAAGEPVSVPDCRSDPRFAAAVAERIGYVPHTMLVVPLRDTGAVVGALSLLDRRDGEPFDALDATRAALFAELAVAAVRDEPAPAGATLPARQSLGM